MAETEIAETENLYFQTTDVFGRSPNTPNSYNRRIPNTQNGCARVRKFSSKFYRKFSERYSFGDK